MNEWQNNWEQEEKKKRGCWFYGCITALVLFVVLVGTVVFGLWKMADTMVKRYTETEPLVFSGESYSPEDAEHAAQKFQVFSETLQKQQGPATLELSEPEINSWLVHNEGFNQYDIQAEVTLDEDTAGGKISLPLQDILPFGFGKGRYLNGAAKLDITTRDGKLFIFIQELEVKGEPLPEVIMSELRTVNLAEPPDDPESEGYDQEQPFENIQSIDIEEGKIRITALPSDQ